MKQFQLFLLCCLLIFSLLACMQRAPADSNTTLYTTANTTDDTTVITTADTATGTFTQDTTTPPDTIPPVIYPNVLDPLDVDIKFFKPTDITEYNDLTVITNGEISYICTPRGDVIYQVEGTPQRCSYVNCNIFSYDPQNEFGFVIEVNKDTTYSIRENVRGGHGGASGKYIYDTVTKETYRFSSSDSPSIITKMSEEEKNPNLPFYPAIAYPLPEGVIENFMQDPGIFNYREVTGKYGLVDNNNNIILPFEYDSIRKNGYSQYYLAVKDGTRYIFDYDANFYEKTFELAGAPYSLQGYDGKNFVRQVAWVYDEAEGCRLIVLDEQIRS